MKAGGPILLVESDVLTRESMCMVLDMEGFPCVSVSDGEEALRYLASHPLPCVILTSLILPGGFDGFGLIARLMVHVTWRDIPVVVVSAWKPRDPIPHARLFIPKPFSMDDLVSVVAPYCARREPPRG